MTWQKIETAPKDGTYIIMYWVRSGLAVTGCWEMIDGGNWETGEEAFYGWSAQDDVVFLDDPSKDPTHWMPLPACPQSTK